MGKIPPSIHGICQFYQAIHLLINAVPGEILPKGDE